MTEYTDVYNWTSESADGNQVVQVRRRFMEGANPTLTPEECRVLLDALAHGNIGAAADGLGLRYMHIMYCRQQNGLKATVMV